MLNRSNLLSLLTLGCLGINNGSMNVVTGFTTTTNTPSKKYTISSLRRDYPTTSPLLQMSAATTNDDEEDQLSVAMKSRRSYLTNGVWSAITAAAVTLPNTAGASDEPESIYAPKFVQQYDDFTETPEGWSYRIVKEGPKGGDTATVGDRVVFDWSGYTIGYFGRPFEAKGGPQGGAFDKDLDYSRTVVGSGSMVKGFESALVGMKPGDIRQVVVPYGPLSYPPTTDGDATHDKVGPKPTTFSGQRALNFVLDNPRVDRTLLFNVKIMRVDKPNGKGGFVRG